jgi:ribosomal protein L15
MMNTCWGMVRGDGPKRNSGSLGRNFEFLPQRNDDDSAAASPPALSPPSTAMPPRLQVVRFASSLLATCPRAPAVQFAIPASQRCASILSSLSDNAGAYNKKIRRGRGPASGKGKTAGRGQKGQHAHGKVPAGFEGGQTPQSITNPERGRGKYNPFTVDMSPVNLDRIQSWIDQGRLDPSKPITMKELHKSRCLHGVKRHGVKLLARVRLVFWCPRETCEGLLTLHAESGAAQDTHQHRRLARLGRGHLPHRSPRRQRHDALLLADVD